LIDCQCKNCTLNNNICQWSLPIRQAGLLAGRQGGGMIKLMVIDDEKGICDFVHDFFKRRGHKVVTLTTPQKAIEAVDEEMPQIVLLDIMMGPVNGLDILKSIKEKYKKIKVVMVTVADDPETRKKAMELGADGFVTKPFTTQYLESVVAAKVEEISR